MAVSLTHDIKAETLYNHAVFTNIHVGLESDRVEVE